MSTFDGKVKEIKEISVDNFSGSRNLESTAYFLSHCHTDHMVGLDQNDFSDALMNRDGVYLYTSEISRCILKNDNKFRHLAAKIKPLRPDQPEILVIPSLLDKDKPKEITVSVISAGHCPGSVMFFFEFDNKKVLYTGDFRVNMGYNKKFQHLHHKDGTPKEIDVCYLDATFFDESYMNFPSRESSLLKISDLIKEWLDTNPNSQILLDRPAKYGYEHVYKGLSSVVGMKIHVAEDIYLKYRNVKEIESALTKDHSETKIHACGQKRFGKYLPCISKNVEAQIIRFSCQWYKRLYESKGTIIEKCPNYTRVCYACHCSYSELVKFLRYLSPKKVIPFAIPEGKTTEKVKEEISQILKDCNRKRILNYHSSDDFVSVQLKFQVKKKILSSPRKARPIIRISPEMSYEESWLRDCSSDHMVEKTSKRLLDTEICIPGSSSHNSQKTESACCSEESDEELSPSLLPQCSVKSEDPTYGRYSPECLPINENKSQKVIEVITLSSDESTELFELE